MLDESLPTFYIKASKEVKHDATILLSQYGNEAIPAYTLRRPDPANPESHNRYAVALYDAYNPGILFGEVLLVPEWTRPPQLSPEELRRNGGVQPAPQPTMPNEFIVNLYNPDQQVRVVNFPSTWKEAQHWDFDMPQQTFRLPSASSLDIEENDPTTSEATPRLQLSWKRDGKFSKDLLCNLSGRASESDGRRWQRKKEPDIPMCLLRNEREISIYEPNLHRVEIEDLKGFEVILILSAVTIKDVYFNSLRDAFNISEITKSFKSVPGAGPGRKSSAGPASPINQTLPMHPKQPQSLVTGQPQHGYTTQSPTGNSPHQPLPLPGARPDPMQVASPQQQNPASPWPQRAPSPNPSTGFGYTNATPPNQHQQPQPQQVNATTPTPPPVQQAQAEAEERERARREKAEMKRIKRMIEEEEKAEKKKQADIDRETERLRREYEAEKKRVEKAQKDAKKDKKGKAPVSSYKTAATTSTSSGTPVQHTPPTLPPRHSAPAVPPAQPFLLPQQQQQPHLQLPWGGQQQPQPWGRSGGLSNLAVPQGQYHPQIPGGHFFGYMQPQPQQPQTGSAQLQVQNHGPKPKRSSFFGLRGGIEGQAEQSPALLKKKSAIF